MKLSWHNLKNLRTRSGIHGGWGRQTICRRLLWCWSSRPSLDRVANKEEEKREMRKKKKRSGRAEKEGSSRLY